MRRIPALAFLVALALAGCAIRYDQTGVSRTGVFLWGLGDPPGVKWNLDWPRREVPDLPPSTLREVVLPMPARAPQALPPLPANGRAPERSPVTFDDNPERVARRAPESASAPVVPRAGDRRDDDARR
jgi:hypothetical protein